MLNKSTVLKGFVFDIFFVQYVRHIVEILDTLPGVPSTNFAKKTSRALQGNPLLKSLISRKNGCKQFYGLLRLNARHFNENFAKQ